MLRMMKELGVGLEDDGGDMATVDNSQWLGKEIWEDGLWQRIAEGQQWMSGFSWHGSESHWTYCDCGWSGMRGVLGLFHKDEQWEDVDGSAIHGWVVRDECGAGRITVDELRQQGIKNTWEEYLSSAWTGKPRQMFDVLVCLSLWQPELWGQRGAVIYHIAVSPSSVSFSIVYSDNSYGYRGILGNDIWALHSEPRSPILSVALLGWFYFQHARDRYTSNVGSGFELQASVRMLVFDLMMVIMDVKIYSISTDVGLRLCPYEERGCYSDHSKPWIATKYEAQQRMSGFALGWGIIFRRRIGTGAIPCSEE
ncbi:hypothetical protein EDD18DRAFT_1109128 [Armillaria luteobubalina]|uniref:Uncharacterized protein n=1 Tax=Armillaria luteobubalina TaxID=153913 RepID=A0AA39PXI8_9AGAR|nr:hypothetical protein EDD18DRAFT_1109128 [Armillaria luteobubalina]